MANDTIQRLKCVIGYVNVKSIGKLVEKNDL